MLGLTPAKDSPFFPFFHDRDKLKLHPPTPKYSSTEPSTDRSYLLCSVCLKLPDCDLFCFVLGTRLPAFVCEVDVSFLGAERKRITKN